MAVLVAEVEAELERRIQAGAQPDDFLCFDCLRWSLDPAYCGCWERPLFLEERLV